MLGHKTTTLIDNIAQLLEFSSDICNVIANEIDNADIQYEKLYDDFHSGGWYTATLYAPGDGKSSGVVRDGTAKPTPLTKRLPVTWSFLESLDLDFFAVRVARMENDSYMWEHRDYIELNQEKKRLRLHVPLSTNPEAVIHFPGCKIHMAHGWLWKLNPTASHAASNSGPDYRTHLLLDCYINETLREMLKHEKLNENHVERLPKLGFEERGDVLRQSQTILLQEGMEKAEEHLLKTFHQYELQGETSYDLLIGMYGDMGFASRERYWIDKQVTRIYNRDSGSPKTDIRRAVWSEPCASGSYLPQVSILQQIMASFQQFSGFEKGFVRGSFARGTADLQSDIDILCEVLPQSFPSFINQADACIKNEHCAVADALVDTIAKDFGGIGFIYLLEVDGNLFQLDLYITCQGRPWGEACGTYRKEIFRREELEYDAEKQVALLYRLHEEMVEQQLRQIRDIEPSVGDTLLELNVLGVMLKKCLTRGDDFVASSEYNMWRNCFIKLIRWKYDVEFRDYGFYHVKRLAVQVGDGGVLYNDLHTIFNSPLNITNFRMVHFYAMSFAQKHFQKDYKCQKKLIDAVLRHIGSSVTKSSLLNLI